MTPPLIALEEHWYSSAVFNSFDNSMKKGIETWPGALEKLFDAGDIRLNEMKRGKVSLQVISHCAADDPSPSVCRAGNDQLANEIQKSEKTTKRFTGFAVLPMSYPEAAAEELERTVKTHGFVGALKAQDLDVPIYLHPSWPSEELFQLSYAGNYPSRAMTTIGGAMWGWHSEVALHVLRLNAAGVFDKFPRLKIILGHFGEMMPFMLHRIQDFETMMGKRERPFIQVWNENIWMTTSGVWSLDPMRCILSNTKIEHIMYSIDYPFSKNENGLEWIQRLEESGLVTQEQLELIAYKNAENLLRIKVPSEG